MGDIHHPGIVPLRARVSFLALERGTLHASNHALSIERETGTVALPCGTATVLLLEPGVTVTHAAVKLCAEHGTLLVWIGEAGVHVYSAGRYASGANTTRLVRQVSLCTHNRRRMAAARRLYARMFDEHFPPTRDIEALRGVEGARVKAIYANLAAERGIAWQSREAAPKRLRDALGYATSTLYGVSEAVILGAGYTPSIGVVHGADARALVFDLADTVKFKSVVPAAFDVYLEGVADVRSAVRRRCRDLFRATRIIDTLFGNLAYIMGEDL